MKYALPMSIFAVVAALAAVLVGDWAYLLLWPAACFGFVAIAYFIERPSLLGKRLDGSRPWLLRLFLAPYLALTWTKRKLEGRKTSLFYAEVVPGVWIGRRPVPGGLPDGVKVVLDLTSEFRPPNYGDGIDVWCLPMLDGTPGELEDLLATLGRAAKQDAIFVHCAQGRGRSGLFTAALLIARGDATDADDAWAKVTAAKPDARLNRRQRAVFEAVAKRLSS